MDTTDDRYRRAKARVAALRGFWVHLSVYVMVNLFLAALNLVTSPNILWFIFPALGWGIGLAAHGLTVFGFGSWFGQDWEERKIRELMDKDRDRGSTL